ncbi:hypothetical protein [Pseudomonas oryzihabitans]|uniref:hypothetical protein n=1 Tax=Pseudomonas oryzihabitans TaxID=47885 RepID=UPI001ABFD93F|nr:hypothetical protein [Pseudomonas oryzihabitans]
MLTGRCITTPLLAIPALLILLSGSAHAATQLASDFKIEQTTTSYQFVPNLTTPKAVTLAANQPVYVYAKGTTTSDTASGIMMFGMQVACGTSTTKLADSYQTTRNHEGTLAYPDTPGKLSLQVRYLFVPPTAGSYVCTVMVKNLFGKGDAKTLTLKAGSATYITDPSPAIGAGVWGIENDKSDFDWAGRPASPTEQKCVRGDAALDPPIDGVSNTSTYCKGSVHIGPGLPAGQSVYALRTGQWTPSASAKTIKGIADIELTSCYDQTGSCPPYAWGSPANKTAGSVVKSRLVVQKFLAGSTTACATFNSTDQTTEITSNAHHLKVYHDLSGLDVATNSASCGASSYFVSKIYLTWLSGNPVRIEDSRYSQNILMNE